jgi:peptidoglycan/LPS O-acetylase OafA/YrhL
MARMNQDPRARNVAGRGGRFHFLEALRAIAAPLVFFNHVVLWTGVQAVDFPVSDLVQRTVIDPLQLVQPMGFVGVALFFLISGFIITHVGVAERHREFAVKRVLRIYPALTTTVLLTAALLLLGLHPLSTGAHYWVTPFTILTNVTLANFLINPDVVLIGVAWTLVIEVLFYLCTFLLLPLLRRVTWLAIAIELEVVGLLVLTAREFGYSYFALAVSASFLPALLLGQIVWAVWSRRLSGWAATVLGIGAWLIFVWADKRDISRVTDAYNLTLLLCLLVFVIGLLAEPRLRPSRVLRFLADRSYSLYLLHSVVAFTVLDLLTPSLGFVVALAAALLATFAVVELSYRFVELPAQRLARRIWRRRSGHRDPPGRTAAPEPEPNERTTPLVAVAGRGRPSRPWTSQGRMARGDSTRP